MADPTKEPQESNKDELSLNELDNVTGGDKGDKVTNLEMPLGGVLTVVERGGQVTGQWMSTKTGEFGPLVKD